ncbi:MAG: right-handed parallel beta-helix repeat-containing protein [Actinobacteria bacterium]|nr:right-handed parallel beta-helix repeat-containing protein [Actinomycetota bacterium]
MRRATVALSSVLLLVLVPATHARAAVRIRAGADIQAKIDAHPAGTTFRLDAGKWHLTSTLEPKSGDRILGAGMGRTILYGVGRTFDGIAGKTSTKDVEIAYLTVRGFQQGVRTGSGWVLHNMQMTADQIGVRMNGVGPVVRGSYIHHNVQFGVLGTTSKGRFLSNEVSYNRTDRTLDSGYSGATKWVHSTGLLVRGNYVHNNYGKGLWLDIEDHGCKLVNNVVRKNLEEGIRVEIGFGNVVVGNRVRRNGGGGINVLNSSDTVVRGNTISGPASALYVLRFAGNGRKSDTGVEYTNTNNRAESNTIRLSSGQSVGVIRTAGTTSGNSFDWNSYRVSALTDRYFKWWDGTAQWTVAWSDWQGFGQDLNGSIVRV